MGSYTILVLLLSVQLVFGQVSTTRTPKLLYLQLMFRHGDRNPIALYKNDPNSPEDFPEGFEMLTKLGKKQHLHLGLFLGRRYKKFITSDPKEVVVESVPIDRCLMSAESNVAGFFRPDHDHLLEPGFYWHPIPIHYLMVGKKESKHDIDDCPRFYLELYKSSKSPEGQALFAQHQPMIDAVSHYSGMNISDFKNATILYDTLFIEKKYNKTIPSWVSNYWDEYSDFANKLWQIFNTPPVLKLMAGPILQDFIDNMKDKIAGKLPYQKVHMYSAHDETILVVLQALNIYNDLRPPYASTFIVELYEMPDGVNSVRMIYFNSTRPEDGHQTPHVFTLEGCTEFCPLDYFASTAQPVLPDDTISC